MRVILDPAWSLEEALEATWAAYVGRGVQSTIYKVMTIKAWANVVGRRRAVTQFAGLLAQFGTKKAMANWIGISVSTLRGIELHFEQVPEHSVVGPAVPGNDRFDAIDFVERIGGGGYGTVWRARDSLGRQIAVKFIHDDNVEAADVALQHATSLARTGGHPNIVIVHYCRPIAHPEGGHPRVGIVMEFLDGVTLREWLMQLHPAALAIQIGLGIADAVSFIHARGLLHGDLHADNIMVVNDSAKVIDILNVKGLTALTSGPRATATNADAEDLKGLLLELFTHASRDATRLLDNPDWIRAITPLEIRHLFEALATTNAEPMLDRMKFMSAWVELERLLVGFGKPTGRFQPVGMAVNDLMKRNVLPAQLGERILALRTVRNEFVHGDPTVVELSHIAEAQGVLRELAALAPQ